MPQMFNKVKKRSQTYRNILLKNSRARSAPKNKIDIEEFTKKSNEATLAMFKSSKDFVVDYVLEDFMDYDAKISDLPFYKKSYVK